MFIAQKELKVMKDGKPFFYKPGDEIPDFDKWDIHAHRAHLNMDWVIEVEDKKAKTASKVASAVKAAVKTAAKKVKRGSVKKTEPVKQAAKKAEKPMQKVKAKAKPQKADKKISEADHGTEE
jgi:hypothetical protein